MESQFMYTCKNPIIVVLDLEATGLDEDDQIIQIAACTRDTVFNVYVTPTKHVNPKASEITGLELNYGRLYLNGVMVYSKSPVEAFNDFLHYLRSLSGKVTFVAHNGFKFDMPKIIKLAKQLGFLEEFEALVSGFSDSLIMFRNVLQERVAQRKRFSMKALVEDYIGDASGLHNANNDVLMLLKLLDITGISDEYIVKQSRTIDRHLYFETVNNLRDYNGVVPTWMICRLANNRIDSEVLVETYNNLGYDGINNLFKEMINGKPRVTDDEHFINIVCQKLFDDSNKWNDIAALQPTVIIQDTKYNVNNSYSEYNNNANFPILNMDYDDYVQNLFLAIQPRNWVKPYPTGISRVNPLTTRMITMKPNDLLCRPYYYHLL